MEISISALRDKVNELSDSSWRVSSEIACASQDLKSLANHLAMLTRGSRSGEEATELLRQSVKSLERAASAIVLVIPACDDYIRNVER